MQFIHIIVLAEVVITLFCIYFIIKKHNKISLLSREKDFIDTFTENKAAYLHKKGVSLSLQWYLRIMMIAPLVLGTATYIASQKGLIAVFVGAAGLFVPELLVYFLSHNANKKMEERYARSLQQLSSSLRAGRSITQSVKDVADCKFLHESMRAQYAKMSADLNMGISIKEAFYRFAENTANKDALDVALAIEIQSEIGGHEADVIQQIAESIQNRIMLRREVSTILAEPSFMVMIFDFLPFAVMLGFTVVNSDFLGFYFSSPLYMLVFAVCIIIPIFGCLVNHRMVGKIKKGA